MDGKGAGAGKAETDPSAFRWREGTPFRPSPEARPTPSPNVLWRYMGWLGECVDLALHFLSGPSPVDPSVTRWQEFKEFAKGCYLVWASIFGTLALVLVVDCGTRPFFWIWKRLARSPNFREWFTTVVNERLFLLELD